MTRFTPYLINCCITMLLLCGISPARSQTTAHDPAITPAELIKLSDCNWYDCVADYLLTRDYNLIGTTPSATNDIYYFGYYAHSGPASKNPYLVLLYIGKAPGEKNCISFTTTSATVYKAMKDAFTGGLAFTYTSSETSGSRPGATSKYRSAKYPGRELEISTQIMNEDGASTTGYSFALSRL